MQSTSQTMDLTEKYSYGYRELDNLTGGLHSGELILVAARPAMGKTAFALNIVNNLLKNNNTVAFFSLDESAEQISFRLHKMRNSEHVKGSSLRIYDDPQMTVKDFETSCENIPNLDTIIIDYLQLIDANAHDANNIDWLSSTYSSKLPDLKLLAQKLNVPVICLSQLGRKLEYRADKRPILADINDYNTLQKDVDQILFLYRDDYYHGDEMTINLMDVIIAKTPHSCCGACKFHFDYNTCKIKEARAELHLHTIYSTKDGMMPVRDITIKAKEMGLSAVAITDHGNMQGFPDAEHASKKYGIKIIYGMECDCIDDLSGNETPFNITLLAKNKTGLKNLYQLISLSHMHNCCEEPPIPKSLLVEHREGLLVGAYCNDGAILNALANGCDDEILAKIAQFYDYFEIVPRKDMQEINLRIAEMAEKLDKPVIATSDARYLTQEYALGHKVLRHCFGDPEVKNEWQHFRSTEELLDTFSYLGEDLCYKAVVTNTQLLADMCEEFDLFPDGRHFPDIKDSAENLTALCQEKIHQLYGENPPTEVLDRLQAELDIILPNKYDSIYILTRELARHSLSQGYPVGIRGVGGNSFVSFLLGITDFNPLPAHRRCSCGYADFINNDTACPICGKDMMADGFNLLYEAFLGLPEDPKVPDFDLDIPKNCWKSTEKLLKDMFGEDHIFYAGVTKCLYESVARQMVRTYASDKNIPFSRNEIESLAEQLTGIRIKDDFHISGHVIIPTNMEVTDFCPIQHCNGKPTVMTQFEYHYMMDALYKTDLFIDKNSDLLHDFAEDIGIDWRSIPLDDEETFELICSGDVDGIPELHTEYARRMVKTLQPATFDDLVRIVCFGHDTDAWKDNAEVLIKNGIPLKDTISSREDVILYLIDKGMDRKLAYRIMEKVRKGMGLSDQYQEAMCNLGVPDWYIDSCNKVRYLFPKAHCISSVLFAYRMAWYKAHFPELYTKPVYVRV